MIDMTKYTDKSIKNLAMNILYNARIETELYLKDFFIVDVEGRKDGRFKMHRTIDYLSAFMPFDLVWSIRVPFEQFLAACWTKY